MLVAALTAGTGAWQPRREDFIYPFPTGADAAALQTQTPPAAVRVFAFRLRAAGERRALRAADKDAGIAQSSSFASDSLPLSPPPTFPLDLDFVSFPPFEQISNNEQTTQLCNWAPFAVCEELPQVSPGWAPGDRSRGLGDDPGEKTPPLESRVRGAR